MTSDDTRFCGWYRGAAGRVACRGDAAVVRRGHADGAHTDAADDGHRYVLGLDQRRTARHRTTSRHWPRARSTATLTAVGPDAMGADGTALVVGFGVGTWTGTVCTISPGTAQDRAVQSSVLYGNVNAAVSCASACSTSAIVTRFQSTTP